jgi:aminoglycoside phosphotransferase (APT) family kinase protein|tara:strand:- start:290 stop:1408 length:1119 start_codon:yes stop_codon:yes gene_type:complete
MDIKVSIELPSSVENTWKYIADIQSHTQWMQDALSITITSDEYEGVGTIFECLTAVGPFRLTDKMEITDWQPPYLMGVKHNGLVSGRGRFTLEIIETGTLFTWEEDLELSWNYGGKFGESLAAPILKAIWKKNLRALRAQILNRQLPTESQTSEDLNHKRETSLTSQIRSTENMTPGPSVIREADAIKIVRASKYPAPNIVGEPADGSIILEKLEGSTMLKDLTSKPWRIHRHAKTLAQLHRKLGDIEAPSSWAQVCPGSSVLHLDLHPGNVFITTDGPVVVSWNTVARGSVSFDAAFTYVMLRTGETDSKLFAHLAINIFRKTFAQFFARAFGKEQIERYLREAAELRLLNTNLSATERERVFALARGELD